MHSAQPRPRRGSRLFGCVCMRAQRAPRLDHHVTLQESPPSVGPALLPAATASLPASGDHPVPLLGADDQPTLHMGKQVWKVEDLPSISGLESGKETTFS